MSGPFVMPILSRVNEAVKFKYTNLVAALETITVPAYDTNDFLIDWGDGSAVERITTSNPTHEYTLAGSYQVSLWGEMPAFGFGTTAASVLNMTSVDQFGTTGLTLVLGFAQDCINCTYIDAQSLDAAPINNFTSFIRGCSALTSLDVSGWDTSGVITFNSFARDCILLTGLDVSGWDTGNVVTFTSFASTCSALATLDVSGWDTSSVTSFASFVILCTSLVTLNTDSWDTRSVTACSSMARLCTSLTSSFDEYRWWNRTDDLTSGGTPDPIAVFNDCFTGSTNISNYASIPNDWKGL